MGKNVYSLHRVKIKNRKPIYSCYYIYIFDGSSFPLEKTTHYMYISNKRPFSNYTSNSYFYYIYNRSLLQNSIVY